MLSHHDVHDLLAACGTRPSGLRLAALISTLYFAGARLSAALQLEIGHFDRRDGWLSIAGQPRLQLLGDTRAWLDRWLRYRRAAGIDCVPMFCTRRCTPLDPSYVRHALRRTARRAGLSAPVSAEALRRAGVQRLVGDGADVAAVRAYLGHASDRATRQYLRRAVPADESGERSLHEA